MPRSVRLGFTFYLIATVLTPLAGALDPTLGAASGSTFGMLLAVIVAVLALKAFLVLFAWRRRNWARIALLIFTGLGLGAHVPQLLRTLNRVPLLGSADLLDVLLEAVAIVLLFTPVANRWYKGPVPAPPGVQAQR